MILLLKAWERYLVDKLTNRIVIVGAGVSKGYEDSPTGIRMPVANDFFSTFNNLGVSANPYVRVGHVINHFAATRHKSPLEFAFFNEDIEVFHSEIEESLADAISKKDRHEAVKLLAVGTQLTFMFVTVLNEIQNGPPSLLHKKLISQLNESDTIITFNWDTLIDRALDENTDWTPESGYLVAPLAVFDNSWQPTAGAPLCVPSSPVLLKLHGSSNWLTSYRMLDENLRITGTHDTKPSDFCVYRTSVDPYDCYDGRYMDGYQPYSYGYYPPNLKFPGKPAPKGHVIVSMTPKGPFIPKGDHGKSGLVSMPLIIPPVKHKDYEQFGDLFRTLWKSAEDKIAEADEIHVYGYSFPRTDTQSRQLLLNAFQRRSLPPKIIIINPHPDTIVEMFTLMLGVPINNIQVLTEYIDKDFEFDQLAS